MINERASIFLIKQMTFNQAFHTTDDWKHRAYLIATFHNMQLYYNKDWKLINSANYFEISIGSISEFLTINAHWDEIKNCQSKNAALKRIKQNGTSMETT